MTQQDKFVNVLFDARQLSALEYIKRVRHFSTSGDAVRACVLDVAKDMGWIEPEVAPKIRTPRKSSPRRKKVPAIEGVTRGAKTLVN